MDFGLKIVQPEKMIEEVVGELKLKAQQKGLKLIFYSPEKISYLKLNPNRLREIIFNLVDNAIKYTFSGQIEISTQQDLSRKRYYIIIQDTGIGIPAEVQKRLFEKFYRVKTRETLIFQELAWGCG